VQLRMTLGRLVLLVALSLAAACSMVQSRPAPLGSEQNPVKLAFGPSADAPKVLAASQELTRALEKETGLRFKLLVPTSYAATIEGMTTTGIDVAWLSPLAYVQAHQAVGAEAILTGLRDGSPLSTGQIVVRTDSGITTLKGLRGKRFAFVDQTSGFGYLLPKAVFKGSGIDLHGFFSETTFAGSDSKVIQAVYDRKADGGATSADRLPDGDRDPRMRLEESLPDVMTATRVIGRTEPMPNDGICVRKGVSPEIVEKVRSGLLRVAQTDVGQKALRDLYGADGLAPIADADFEQVRRAAASLNPGDEQDATPTPTSK
jgi:phosphonate transport system substrate-binding protein